MEHSPGTQRDPYLERMVSQIYPTEPHLSLILKPVSALDFPFGVLGQVWFLIVPIPGLCLLYFAPRNWYVLRHKAGQEGRGEILLENSFRR